MKTILYHLTLMEPLLATGPGSDPNTEKSHPFIPGSVLRGAWASQFDASNETFTRLFLTGQTRFHNAYPAPANKQTLPLPLSWKREKDPADPQDRQVYDWLYKVESMPKATKNLPGSFFVVDDGVINTVQVDWDIAVHNSRSRRAGRALEDDGALFRYQALAAGQRFVGTIEFDGEVDSDLFLDWLANNDYLLLGGSHSAGYGLTKVELLSDAEAADDKKSVIRAGEPFVLYLASDAILTDPLTGQPGAPITSVLADALPEAGEIALHQAFSRTRWVAGFNNKWGLPLPQTWAYQMGSLWQLSTQHEVSADGWQVLEAKGLGERQAEGFGKILINPFWLQPGQAFRYNPVDIELAQEPLLTEELQEESADLLQQMNERLVEQELNRRLQTAAHHIAGKFPKRRLSQSQLGRLRLRIRATYENEAGLTAFTDYLQETKKRKSVDDQFRKVSVRKGKNGRQNFRAWMQELAGNPVSVWEQLDLNESESGWLLRGKQWQRPFLGTDPFVLTEEHSRHYAARLIEAVCEQASRGGRS